ncbi:hypothetical protein [Martelella sp. HB161492]|uniref:hypothetical protein n=1 Tax=Martelella sp. HB161492 TaxID=2720726 RepID=UPI0015912484|nr:hypothetical protein [Martelella sp. HB161492]
MARRGLICLTAAALLGTVVATTAAAEPDCHANDRYRVAVQPHQSTPGERFAVVPVNAATQGLPCRFEDDGNAVIIGSDDDPLWFAGLSGDYLVATRSTGPEGDLVVFQLESGEKILDRPAGDFSLEDDALSFWQRQRPAVTGECPALAEDEKAGLSIVIETQIRFDFVTLTPQETGEIRCAAVQ